MNIPSYGLATTPLTLIPYTNASLGPHSFFITARSDFPPDELITIQGKHSILPENTVKRSNVLLTINKSPDLLDQISNSWGKVGDFSQFLYGIIAGLSPWIYEKIKDRRHKNSKEQNHKSSIK